MTTGQHYVTNEQDKKSPKHLIGQHLHIHNLPYSYTMALVIKVIK